MTNDDYVKAVNQDKKYVDRQLSSWKAQLKATEDQVEFWERQAQAISTVSFRAEAHKDTGFSGEKPQAKTQ